jgi:hypothetical protein
MDSTDKTLLGVIPAMDADILTSQLSRAGVDVLTVFNHSTCKSGCSPSKEIWVHPEDLLFIQRFMSDRHMQALKDLGADLEQISQVFDPSKPTAICPACGTTFTTDLTNCPDCDLVFG